MSALKSLREIKKFQKKIQSDPELARALKLLNDEEWVKDEGVRDELLGLLQEKGGVMVDLIVKIGEMNLKASKFTMVPFPTLDHIRRFARLKAHNMFADGRINGFLVKLSKAFNEQARLLGIQMLVDVEVGLQDGSMTQTILEVLMKDKDKNVRGFIAHEVSKINWDERIVEGLIAALNDRGELVPKDAGLDLSDLFIKYPTVADVAAKSLEKIGTPQALAAIRSFDIHEELPSEDDFRA